MFKSLFFYNICSSRNRSAKLDWLVISKPNFTFLQSNIQHVFLLLLQIDYLNKLKVVIMIHDDDVDVDSVFLEENTIFGKKVCFRVNFTESFR